MIPFFLFLFLFLLFFFWLLFTNILFSPSMPLLEFQAPSVLSWLHDSTDRLQGKSKGEPLPPFSIPKWRPFIKFSQWYWGQAPTVNNTFSIFQEEPKETTTQRKPCSGPRMRPRCPFGGPLLEISPCLASTICVAKLSSLWSSSQRPGSKERRTSPSSTQTIICLPSSHSLPNDQQWQYTFLPEQTPPSPTRMRHHSLAPA